MTRPSVVHSHQAQLRGTPLPLGATFTDGGMNFSIYSSSSKLALLLFESSDPTSPAHVVELDPTQNRTGSVWHTVIPWARPGILYAYQIHPESPLILDPYAKALFTPTEWGQFPLPYSPLCATLPKKEFDWGDDRHPRISRKELVIYEMHARGFTQDPSSKTMHPGTFLGIVEKLHYLKKLGINAVECLPVTEFNERENRMFSPTTGQPLLNYFGYAPVNFFCPMRRYSPAAMDPITAFKTFVKACHAEGIEVILDLVYNHTFEGGGNTAVASFRSLDQEGYYLFNEAGEDLNFSGCGHTFYANHPIAAELILDSLRYWVVEMHIDGFRFDLASVFYRGKTGAHLEYSPLVEAISDDPILTGTKLIAEAWDSAGLYQVGGFYSGARWSEWNGWYRDTVRKFIKGSPDTKKDFATAVSGSQNLYGSGRSPKCSVNFVTCHDGFTLMDLVSYHEKHNLPNGEENRDGTDCNESWNCGEEGPSENGTVLALREQQRRNFMLALMVSQGTPMLLMGDEYGHTKQGNNNTWCQDNRLNWFLWDLLQQDEPFHHYVSSLIWFRRNHPLLGREDFLSERDVQWHGAFPYQPGWDDPNPYLGWSLLDANGLHSIYAGFNPGTAAQTIQLPELPAGNTWCWVVNTNYTAPHDFFSQQMPTVVDSSNITLAPYSAILLSCQ